LTAICSIATVVIRIEWLDGEEKAEECSISEHDKSIIVTVRIMHIARASCKMINGSFFLIGYIFTEFDGKNFVE